MIRTSISRFLDTLRPSTDPNAVPRSLRHNFSWTLAGNVVLAASNWLLLVIAARLGSPAMVGQFALGLAVSTPIFLFFGLNLRVVQATDARGEFTFREYFQLRLATTMLALVANILVVAFAYGPLSVQMILVAVGGWRAADSMSDVYLGALQLRERMDRLAVSQILHGVSGVAAFFAGLYATGSMTTATISLIVAWILVLLFFDVPAAVACGALASRYRTESNAPALVPLPRQQLLRLAGIAFPLGLVAALGSLAQNIPRYFLESSRGEDALGVFAAVSAIMFAGSTVVAALAHATTPRLARLHAEGDDRGFRRIMKKLHAIAAAMGVGGVAVAWWVGAPVLRLLYGPEYSEHATLFVWLMIAGAATYFGAFLGVAVTAMRRFRFQAQIHAANVLLVFLLAAALVPRFGLLGAAWCALGSAIFVNSSFYLAAHLALRRDDTGGHER